MADTVRALSALQTLYANNTTRAIDEQDLRDGFYSAIGVRPYAAKTADYTATESDDVILVNATGGVVTITLPAVASARVGKTYTIEKTDTSVNAVVVDGNASETLDGQTTLIVFTQYGSVTIFNTGSEWLIIAQRGVTSGRIFAQTVAAGQTVASTNAETTLLGTGIGSLTLPANFYRIGRALRFRAMGYVSDTATPTLTLKFKHGSTVLATSGALTLGSGISNIFWEVCLEVLCVATGSSNTLWTQGWTSILDGTNTLKTMGNSSRANVDIAASQVVDCTATWSASSSSNTATCTNALLEITA